MRDPDRIDEILTALGKLWHEVPDQRFGQLIENYVIYPGAMWFQDDDETLARINKLLEG